MKPELKAYTYKELNSKVLSKKLEELGMVFVHLPKGHALKYISLHRYLPGGDAFNGNFIKKLASGVSGMMTLMSILVFHCKLLELMSFQVTGEVRVCWDIEESGLYRLTFS